MPEAYMDALNGDWGIAGEGEVTFVELVAALEEGRDPGGIAGIFSPHTRRCAAGSVPAPAIAAPRVE